MGAAARSDGFVAATPHAPRWGAVFWSRVAIGAEALQVLGKDFDEVALTVECSQLVLLLAVDITLLKAEGAPQSTASK
jgi:hypothetical protein